MKLLDLFSGAGGAAMGYHRAGFEVVGVDHKPQKNFPFEFIQADALEYCAEHGHEYDVIHASPPCQSYSRLRHLPFLKERRERHPKLIDPLRDFLIEIGKPYVIENSVTRYKVATISPVNILKVVWFWRRKLILRISDFCNKNRSTLL